MDSVVHFEIPCENKERAGEFYSKAFGWRMNSYPEMKYIVAHTGETDENGMPSRNGFINGGFFDKKSDEITSPLITLNVENIEESLKKITEAGGEIVRGKTTIGDMGYTAYFKDTEGNVNGLWEMMKKDQ